MITNSAVIQIISLVFMANSFLGVIRLGIEYQSLNHQSENLAIQVARKALVHPDTSPREICQLVQVEENQQLESCEITDSEVKVGLSEQTSFLGRALEMGAFSRVGYGFYSQNDP